MASSLALKRFVAATLLHRSLSRTIYPATTSASRFFNTNAFRRYDEDSDDRDVDKDRRSFARRRDSFSYAFDPFSSSQVLNFTDRKSESPFFPRTSDEMRRARDAEEDENALNLRIDMPRLGKEEDDL